MNEVEEIEDFFGVYLLDKTTQSWARRWRRTAHFESWTMDNGYDHSWIPEQYICTKGKLLIFTPNGVRIYYDSDLYCKLKFEWAWQQPRVSRRLKQIADIQKKRRNESYFEYNFRILSEMLRIGPWNRLPLTIRWLADEYHREFEVGKTPPLHMPICFGRIKKVNKKRKPRNAVTNTHKAAESQPPKLTASNQATHAKIPINYDLDEFDRIVMGGEKIDDYISQAARRAEVEEANPINSIIISSDSEEDNDGVEAIGEESKEECTLCRDSIDTRQLEEGGDIVLRCLQPRCRLVSHLECLAQSVLEPGQYVPVEGDCPICETHFLWGDIIRKANGCSDLVDDVENVDPLEVNEVSDEDQ